jgi:TonB family protein
MTKTVLLVTLAFLTLCHFAWPAPATPHEQLGDLLISPSKVDTITETDGRYGRHTAPSGFHSVRVHISLKSVGNKAVCTYLSAYLDTSLGGGSKLGTVRLKAKNGAQTVIGASIHQLLPGEEAEGYIVFSDLRDGVQPVSLKIDSGRQSCNGGAAPEPVTFTIVNGPGGLTIASETAAQAQPVTAKVSEAAEPALPTTESIAIATPDATYTDDARRTRLEGEVRFRVTVGTDGQLHDIQPLNHLGMGLDEQAVAALQEWRFKPATRGGKPVPQTIIVNMSFRLIH